MTSELFKYSAAADRKKAEEALSKRSPSKIRQVWESLGTMGQDLLEAVGIRRGSKPTERQVEDALEIVRDLQLPSGMPNVPPELEPRTTLREPPRPNDLGLSKEYLTPTSSNVYSFQYDYASSTFYVTYKSSQLDSSKVRVKKGAGGATQVFASKGAHRGRVNRRGATYYYLDVPVQVFNKFVYTSSAGGAVWDELRVRGSAWGYQYTYGVLSADVVQVGGVQSSYLPRKATETGYKGRQLRVLGGSRTIRSSMADTGAPDRGIPNRAPPQRGTPNTGAL